MSSMKVCFFSPYIPKHFGGGEKHLFDVATLVATKHQVQIVVGHQSPKQSQSVREAYEKFLGYSLADIEFIDSPLGTNTPFWQKLLWTKQFDYLYSVTDGSLFFSLAKSNNLHIQIPFTQKKTGILERMKLKNWQTINTNSKFTKDIIQDAWQVSVDFVHHPLVRIPELATERSKKKQILSVGRFFRQLHSKRQDVLVSAFGSLIKKYPKHLRGWKLLFVGTVEDEDYFQSIKDQARGLPIEFISSVSRPELIQLYQESSLYWHAAGYGVDEQQHPEKVEHFGISTVEAMAAGAVPVVVGKGGQREVLGSRLTELLWQEPEECIQISKNLIENQTVMKKFRKIAQEQSKRFDEKHFARTTWKMFAS